MLRLLLPLALSVQTLWALPQASSILAYDASESFPATLAPAETWEGGYALQAVTFPSPVSSLFPKNNTVWARLLLPKGQGPFGSAQGKPFPCVVALPILAGSNLWIESRFWRPLLDRGIAVLFIELPYQFHRRPPGAGSGLVFLGRSPETLRANFAQAVLDVRRALTWLSRRPDIDGRRLGVLGISLGALVGAAVYSVDPRLKDAALLLGGADLPRLLADSALTGPTLRRLNIPDSRVAVVADEIDPLLYRDRNAARPALLVNAVWDRIIPVANGVRLREAFPSARQLWVPGGHYSSLVHVPWMRWYVARYFAKSFSSPH